MKKNANKKDDDILVGRRAPSLVQAEQQHKRTGDTTVNHHDRHVEGGKTFQNETTENRDELSVTRSLDMGARNSAVNEEIVFEKGRSMPRTNVHEEQRDDIGADDDNNDEEEVLSVDSEHNSTLDEINSGSGVLSSDELADSESTQAITTADVGTTGSTLWADNGTSPIDFVNAIITGEVWSDLFDDGKYASSHHPRAVSPAFSRQ